MTVKSDHKRRRIAVVVADDMGMSSHINAGIMEAHSNGILTSASLMAGGQAFEEAVEMAAACSDLSVGIHVTLCDGRAVLSPSEIPDLIDHNGCFEQDPAKAWIRYMKAGSLPQIEAEVGAQFERLERAGIRPTHVDGHHHLQMHPAIFEIVCKEAARRGVGWIRMPNEPFAALLSRRSFSRGLMPFIEWLVFRILSAYNLKIAMRYGINAACNTLGLSRTGNIDEECLLDLLEYARDRINEIFTHPDVSTDSGRRELEALTSVKVRDKVASLGMELSGYRGLFPEGIALDSLQSEDVKKGRNILC